MARLARTGTPPGRLADETDDLYVAPAGHIPDQEAVRSTARFPDAEVSRRVVVSIRFGAPLLLSVVGR
jgi:hypothetical protein